MDLPHLPSSADARAALETSGVLIRPSVVASVVRALDEVRCGDTCTEDEVRAALVARGRIDRDRA